MMRNHALHVVGVADGDLAAHQEDVGGQEQNGHPDGRQVLCLVLVHVQHDDDHAPRP